MQSVLLHVRAQVFARTRRTGFAHRSLSSDFVLWIGLNGPSVAGSMDYAMLSLVRLLAFIAWERVGSVVETALEVHRQRRSAVKPLCRFDIEVNCVCVRLPQNIVGSRMV